MKTVFNPQLKAILSLDESEVVRTINHTDELYSCAKDIPRVAALDYLKDISDVLKIHPKTLINAHQKVSYIDPFDQDIVYRLSEEKTFFDSTTLGFYQTFMNVPIWRTGISVTMKHGPNRINLMINNSRYDVKGKLPKAEKIEQFKHLITSERPSHGQAKSNESLAGSTDPDKTLNSLLGIKPATKSKSAKSRNKIEPAKLIRGRFYMYKYESKKRERASIHDPELAPEKYYEKLILPKVDASIKEGNYYLVVEITFSYGNINWLALIDVDTTSVLYVEPLSSGVDGLVFVYDPITKSGVATNTPDQSNAVLNAWRDDVTLPNLDAPISGTQNLRGSFAEVSEIESPTVNAPTKPTGTDFDYQVRTNNFAGVNAYYHTDRFFSMVEDLGFVISNYFNNTSFPVPIDHRGLGSIVNAHCVGNGSGGIGHCCYSLSETTNTTNPMGIAADWRVHLHELGGHGVLYEHVGTANFGFSHSAGDSFAMIQNDPESNAPDRFLFLPFVPSLIRRSDRPVSSWAWGGNNDVGSYSSEQILSTTLFRAYRSIGGDSSALSRRIFARDLMTYLILRTISTFTPGTNPATALAFCNAMMATDLLNWTSRGIYGGAYNKVIRWSFEKQGLFQPSGAPTPVITEGDPPAIDVYIEDGRAGEYEYQAVHWDCHAIWNNNGTTVYSASHEQPILGTTNKAYVKVKNRGTQTATGVNVRAFHCKPGAGLTWPNDFIEMTYTGGAIGNIAGNSSAQIDVGPFEWIPNTNSYGHDCIIMIASATNDPSNIDHFTAGESIAEWRLVPNDNNVGQRNVHPVPGGGGLDGLVAGLHNKSFWAGNPNTKAATMNVKVKLPSILRRKKWDISFQGVSKDGFLLKPNEKREMIFDLKVGDNFTKQEIESTNDKDINVSLFADGALLGGMTYYLDANIKVPINAIDRCNLKCNTHAQELLDCLKLSGQEVKRVKVKKVSLDIEIKNDDCPC